MHTETHIPQDFPREFTTREDDTSGISGILSRKIWLPRSLYVCLPWIYLALGIASIGAALLMDHWSWIMPYFLLLGFACLHAGIVVARLRWRNRHGR